MVVTTTDYSFEGDATTTSVALGGKNGWTWSVCPVRELTESIQVCVFRNGESLADCSAVEGFDATPMIENQLSRVCYPLIKYK